MFSKKIFTFVAVSACVFVGNTKLANFAFAKKNQNIGTSDSRTNSNCSQLFVLMVGPSGSGKTTVIRALMKEYPELQEMLSVTTRAPRKGEVNGIDRKFISKETFLELEKKGEIFEKVENYGNFYGLMQNDIKDALKNKKDLVIDITMEGVDILKAKLAEMNADFRVIVINIIPPSLHELEKRLRSRKTETEESIQKRLASFKEELKYYKKADYVLVNDSLDFLKSNIDAIYLDKLLERDTCRNADKMVEKLLSS